MSRILAKLVEWQQQGLLSQEQVNAIQNYEFNKATSGRMIHSFVYLGVVTIALGIISLIAANWFDIPDYLKLLADFLLLSLLAVIALRYYEHPQTLRFDTMLLSFLFLVMASIGLISQIFHTQGELYQALLLWGAITLMAVMTARHSLSPLIWVGLVVPSLVYAMTPSGLLLFTSNLKPQFILLILAMTATLITVSLGQLLALQPRSDNLGRAFRFWAPVYGVYSVFYADILISESRGGLGLLTVDFLPYLGIYVVMVLLSLLAIQRNQTLSVARKSLLVFMLFGFSMLLVLVDLGLRSELVGALASISLLFLAALYYGSGDRERLFNLITILIGIRIFIVYLQVIGSLAATGLGLIISGVIMVLAASMWAKHVKQLQQWVKRSFQ